MPEPTTTTERLQADIWEHTTTLDTDQCAAAADAVIAAGWTTEHIPAAVTLQQGDRVLLCYSREIHSRDVERMRLGLEERFPDVDFLIAGPVSGVLVQRGETGDTSGTH